MEVSEDHLQRQSLSRAFEDTIRGHATNNHISEPQSNHMALVCPHCNKPIQNKQKLSHHFLNCKTLKKKRDSLFREREGASPRSLNIWR